MGRCFIFCWKSSHRHDPHSWITYSSTRIEYFSAYMVLLIILRLLAYIPHLSFFLFSHFQWLIKYKKRKTICSSSYVQEQYWGQGRHHFTWACGSGIIFFFPLQVMAKEEKRRAVCSSFEVVRRGWWTWGWTWPSGLTLLIYRIPRIWGIYDYSPHIFLGLNC